MKITNINKERGLSYAALVIGFVAVLCLKFKIVGSNVSLIISIISLLVLVTSQIFKVKRLTGFEKIINVIGVVFMLVCVLVLLYLLVVYLI